MGEVIDMFIALYLYLLFVSWGSQQWTKRPAWISATIAAPISVLYCLFMPEVDELWKAPGIGFLRCQGSRCGVPLEDAGGCRGGEQHFGHLEALQSSLALENFLYLIIQIAGQ